MVYNTPSISKGSRNFFRKLQDNGNFIYMLLTITVISYLLICVTDIVLKLLFLIYAWKYFLIVIYVIQDNYFFYIFSYQESSPSLNTCSFLPF